MTILDNIKNISELCPYLSQEQIDNSSEYILALKNGIFYNVEKFDQNYYKDFNLPLLIKQPPTSVGGCLRMKKITKIITIIRFIIQVIKTT